MVLEINHLHKHYGGVHALSDISLAIDSGTVLGLVGDNGAGKSTLLRCVTGSEKPDSGAILFDGQPLTLGTPHISRSVGIEMIYQDLNLCPQLDVVSNVFLGREHLYNLFGFHLPILDLITMKKKTAALLEGLNAEIDLHKAVGNLSGGQQQAVAIARALLFNPKLLIMDEPTAALGVRETAKVLTLIRSLKQQRITIVLVSHRLGDIFEVADRVVLMRHGRIEEDKPIGEISLSDLTHKIITQ